MGTDETKSHKAAGYKPIADTDEQAFAAAKAHMRDIIRRQGRVLVPDSLRRGDEIAVRLIDEGTSWEPWDGEGTPDGHMIDWHAESVERAKDDGTPVGQVTSRGETEDGRPWVIITLPEHVALHGGGYRVQHDLDGEVTLHAFNGERGVGYLLATALDDNVLHVELFASTTHVQITRDPDDAEYADGDLPDDGVVIL